MIAVRLAAVAIACLVGTILAAPLQAQTTATLTVTARVVEECTVRSKRKLVRLARQRNDPSLIRRCSKGVASRVDQRRVKAASLRPSTVAAPRVSRKRISRSTVAGQGDVVLVTVTY